MLKAVIAMTFALIVAAPGIADKIRHPGTQTAGNCTTTCTRIGNQQICNTHCY